MVEEALLYHTVMVKLFLFTLFADLLLPYFFKGNRAREVKMIRISFFFYSAILVMTAFSGTILYMLMNIPWSGKMSLMLAVFILLAGIEIARSRKLVSVWMAGKSGLPFSWPYILAEIAIMGFMMLYMVIEKKDAVPL